MSKNKVKLSRGMWFFIVVAIMAIAALWVLDFELYSRILYTVIIVMVMLVFIHIDIDQESYYKDRDRFKI